MKSALKVDEQSNFTRWFIGILGRESHILGNFATPEASLEAQKQTNRPAREPARESAWYNTIACIMANVQFNFIGIF